MDSPSVVNGHRFSVALLQLTQLPKLMRIALVISGLTGCQTATHTQKAALVGGGLGALTGAIIGHQTGNAEGGALVGTAIGGLTGGLIGNNQDVRNQRDAAIAQAHYQEMQRQSLRNSDVIEMVRSGLSEEVIIRAIHTQPANYNLSPEGLIRLRECGVSDQILQAMQDAPKPALPSSTSTTGSNVGVDVLVAPQPFFIIGPRRPWHPHGPARFRRWH